LASGSLRIGSSAVSASIILKVTSSPASK
jgi:hypothetical protein